MKSKFPSTELGSSPLVLDASVIINLLATRIPDVLLKALRAPALAAEEALAEVIRHPIPGEDVQAAIGGLIAEKLIRAVQVNGAAKAVYHELVSDDLSGGLDDGEAATIAVALEQSGNAVPVIDETKATRIFHARSNRRVLISTVTLLAQPPIHRDVPQEKLAEAVFSALQFARMRVPAEGAQWVMELIGRERAKMCSSIRRHLPMTD